MGSKMAYSTQKYPYPYNYPFNRHFNSFSLQVLFSPCAPFLPFKPICSYCYLAKKKLQRMFPFISKEQKANTSEKPTRKENTK